jgi:hypothetical protein
MMTTGDPTVFVIDDDDLVERPFKALLKSVGLHTDTFEIPPPSNACRQPILLVAPTCLRSSLPRHLVSKKRHQKDPLPISHRGYDDAICSPLGDEFLKK